MSARSSADPISSPTLEWIPARALRRALKAENCRAATTSQARAERFPDGRASIAALREGLRKKGSRPISASAELPVGAFLGGPERENFEIAGEKQPPPFFGTQDRVSDAGEFTETQHPIPHTRGQRFTE